MVLVILFASQKSILTFVTIYLHSQSIRIGMGKMLGSKVSDEELEEMAKEVEDKLTETITSELKEDAQEFLEDEVNKIENNVDNEEAEGNDYRTIENDVMDQEQDSVINVREEISNAAVDMKTGLRGRAAEIEKQILEERLSLRLGKKVKLVIVGDEVEGVDDLFNGLPSLGGSTANGAGNGGYRNNALQQQQQQGGYRNNVPQQQQQQQQGGYRNNVPQQQQQQQQGGYRNNVPQPQQQQQQPQQQQQQQQQQQEAPKQPEPEQPAAKKNYIGYGLQTGPAGYGFDQNGEGNLPPLP
jgi:hypothetical protein